MSPGRNRIPCLPYQLVHGAEKMAYLLPCNDIPWGLGSFGKCALRTRHLVRKGVGAGLIHQCRYGMEGGHSL